MIKSPIKFAVVGYGHIGRRHADLISDNPDAELVALCDTKVSAEAAGVSTIPYYSNMEEMLEAQPEIDVVNIATPNGCHAQQAITALKSGKHVVIEKPMALSKADAEEIIFTALQRSRQVFVVMQNRYSPPSRWLKNLVESDVLGKINMVQINCYWNRDERYYKKDTWHGSRKLDGGVLYTQFSHFIDVMYWLFGDITHIRSRIKNFNHQELTEIEDSGTVSFDFVNGGTGVLNFSTSCWNKNFESSITVLAENGTLKVGGQYMDEVEYCHIKDYELPKLEASNPPNDYGNYKGSAANHAYVIRNIIEVLKGEASITTNALEGMKVVEIIDRIYQSSKSL